MTNAKCNFPRSYREARDLLTERDGEALKVGNNTKLQWGVMGGEIVPVIVLHSTAIIGYHANGSITLDNGDYYTATTRARLCAFLRATGLGYLYSEKNQWKVSLDRNDLNGDHRFEVPFMRNMRVWRDIDGRVSTVTAPATTEGK